MEDISKIEESLAQYKKENRELKHKVYELTDFVENASIPLHWVDGAGKIIWANQAELDTFGYTKEEYIGFPISNFHADQEVIQDILTRLINNETLHNYQAKLKCRDGSIKHVLINSNVLRKDGRFIHTRCFTRDITAIMQEQQRNRELMLVLEQQGAIIASSNDAVLSKTLEGTITSWNKSAERIFGYTEPEIIGQPVQKLLPPDRRDEESRILSRLWNGDQVEHFETRRLTKTGRILDVSLTISPIRDDKGNIVGLSTIARDISEKKQEEQRKNDFVTMVSHELKTPLTAIMSYIQILIKKTKNEDDFGFKALTKIHAQAKKMASMIHDFLNLARLEDGKIQLNKEIFALHPLVEEIIGDVQILSTKHTVKLIDCEAITVHADRNKIGQVLMNLVSNAIKYSPAGGTITIGCEKHPGKVKVLVSDEGIGISVADQKRLFERFYRVSNNKSGGVTGFGIGLFLVSEILRLHNSKIEVESKENAGSTFYFDLEIQKD
ncbi:PAS domain S-box protein [Pedobacter sp. ISL-68]|uniref:PAS domain S-box protein n=1 Tax=unclassified Pedobacter TaxID=2628915 RepID=UPI001BE9B4D0|nr:MULTISPECIES: PAS domain S-box protein [unclassified Pedobacter]MBT2560479.1 PAS domain S-box protein [Pedobacter sp. ISL-64]MBT2593616.1 PAS domain S-box protein [Pedobacter sp. ISL-68]